MPYYTRNSCKQSNQNNQTSQTYNGGTINNNSSKPSGAIGACPIGPFTVSSYSTSNKGASLR